MSDTFLYILGAGASYNALPLVKDFAADMKKFAQSLESYQPYPENRGTKTWGGDREGLVSALKWLVQEASHHASIDTFAKKLFFRRDNASLKKLKATLSTYLAIRQARQHVDFRYDSFLASVLESDELGSISLPKQLRIVTWNYDIQLERAFYGFCNDEKMVTEQISFNESMVYRVNGRCATNPPGTVHTDWFKVYEESDNDPWTRGIVLYNKYMESATPESEIRFAWEDVVRTRFETSKLDLEEVNTIVVIGYSFPYFNREIDDLILKQIGEIDKIYLQYPEGEHLAIEQRLEKLAPLHSGFVRVDARDLFYIPDNF